VAISLKLPLEKASVTTFFQSNLCFLDIETETYLIEKKENKGTEKKKRKITETVGCRAMGLSIKYIPGLTTHNCF